MTDPDQALARYLDVWNGVADVDALDQLVTPGYTGHLGSRARSLAELKDDLVAYRAKAPDVRFEVVHRFRSGDELAMRLVARATDPVTGTELSACGLNLSRWEDGLLAAEWAVWEPLAPRPEASGRER